MSEMAEHGKGVEDDQYVEHGQEVEDSQYVEGGQAGGNGRAWQDCL